MVREYENFLVAKSAQAAEAPAGRRRRREPGPAGAHRRRAARRRRGSLAGTELLYTQGDPWELEVEWETEDPRLAFHLGVGINRVDGVEVCSFATHLDGLPPLTGERRYAARLRIPSLPLVKGEFTLYIFLLDEGGLHIYDQRMLPSAFTVRSPAYAFGLVRVEHAWDLDAGSGSSVQPRSVAGRGADRSTERRRSQNAKPPACPSSPSPRPVRPRLSSSTRSSTSATTGSTTR